MWDIRAVGVVGVVRGSRVVKDLTVFTMVLMPRKKREGSNERNIPISAVRVRQGWEGDVRECVCVFARICVSTFVEFKLTL